MEQRLSQILRQEHHTTQEISEKPVQSFGLEPLGSSEVCDCMREFAQGREQVEDARRSGRLPDFICDSRIQAMPEEMSIASVQQLAEICRCSPSTVFYVLTFVFRMKFRHWKWIPHFLSDGENQK
jgi:hypothetical protein